MWADGYSPGEPSKRYGHWISRGIWSSLLLELVAATITGITLLLED
jgi:hypothetical protein